VCVCVLRTVFTKNKRHFPSAARGSVRRASGRTPLLGTLEDMLKAPDTGISLHRGSSMSEGMLELGEGGRARIPGINSDE
jgi:hypothetical protein